MLFRSFIKTIWLLLSAMIINGCTPYVGGKCKYDSIEAYAVVKEVKNDHVVLILPAKYAFLVDESHNDKEIILPLRPLQIGESIPIYIERITKGSCVPTGYRYR